MAPINGEGVSRSWGIHEVHLNVRAKLIWLAVFAAVAVAAPARADVRAGVEAYKLGDYEVALREFTKFAEQGEARAQYNLGVMYLKGRGVEKDHAKALKWQLLAAEGGLAAAQHGLGVMFYRGEGVEQDFKNAAKWFRLAADQGYPTAQLNLSVMYFSGQGVERNEAEVVKWVTLAAAKGLPEALYRIGQMYERGAIFDQSLPNAIFWYGKSAERGHEEGRTQAETLKKDLLEVEAGPAIAAKSENRPPGTPPADAADEPRELMPKSVHPAPAPEPRMMVSAADSGSTPAATDIPSGWRVQLASFRTEREARQAWDKLQKAYGEVLAEFRSEVARVDLGGERGVYHRLRVGPLTGRDAAFALCNRLKSVAPGQGCIPLSPGR